MSSLAPGTRTLQILITNNRLARRTGTEIYARDLALSLAGRGHSPVLYSPVLGELAREVRLSTIPIVDDLALVGKAPDVIHGHHHMETMTALLRFPDVPAIWVCHDWYRDSDAPPRFPRIRRYVAIDETCRDRLVLEHGIADEQVRLLSNWVDLKRFAARGPLPERPRRALVFSNYAEENALLGAVREACRRAGLQLDVMGEGTRSGSASPEQVLPQYDLVFAKGRSAVEALAVGTPVILYCMRHAGPMVRSAEIERLLPLNFGIRAMTPPLPPDALSAALEKEIARYDPADTAEASRRVRLAADRETAIDRLVALYQEVIAEQAETRSDPEAEGRAAAAYLRDLGLDWQRQRDAIAGSLSVRLGQRLGSLPVIGSLGLRAARALGKRGR
jgi:hypothetical protein